MEIRAEVDRQIGVYLGHDQTGILIEQTFPGLPADLGGISPGDRLLSINHIPISAYEDFNRAQETMERGRVAIFQIKRGPLELELPIIPGGPFPFISTILNGFLVLICLLLFLLVALGTRQDVRTRLLYLFTWLVALEFSMPDKSVLGHDIGWLTGAGFYLLSGFQFILEIHLASVIPDIHPWRKRSRIFLPGVYFLGLLTGLGGAAIYLMDTADWPAGHNLMHILQVYMDTILFPLWVLLLLFLLGYQALRYPIPLGRHQAGLVLLGILPWAATITITTLMAISGHSLPVWMDVAWSIVLLPYPIAIFIGMYRYDLFDINLVVRKGLIYAFLTGALLGVFYIFLGLGSVILSRTVVGSHPSGWIIALAALLLGLLAQPFRQWTQALIDSRFFPERSQLRQRIVDLAATLPEAGNVEDMAARLADHLKDLFHVRKAALLLADEHAGVLQLVEGEEPIDPILVSLNDPSMTHLLHSRGVQTRSRLPQSSSPLTHYMEREKIEIIVPMKVRGHLAGVILMGETLDGRDPRAEELELMELLAHNTAVVFENARLFTSATYDHLTGLKRREAILLFLAREVERACRYERPLALCMVDVDLFKAVNDTHGHLVGDIVLKRISMTIDHSLRDTDDVGRYGGDEFLIVLPESDADQAREAANRVLTSVRNLSVRLTGAGTLSITVSIGWSVLKKSDQPVEVIVRELLEEADRAMYMAKAEGRDRAVIYKEKTDPNT